ncbi:MAPK regulated corepressor interacting protein 2 isoform X1 [Halichoerus grypus]|uniref:MAPK regulated corepressor interacting protein 2 isoform X4 n=1 Tax=Halichoerus grypus TaxID=9711 RepID=UPI001659A935|nr:MAPK regulated corepressor interacting protein 2 isoform X4 [Halichoerus grypus]
MLGAGAGRGVRPRPRGRLWPPHLRTSAPPPHLAPGRVGGGWGGCARSPLPLWPSGTLAEPEWGGSGPAPGSEELHAADSDSPGDLGRRGQVPLSAKEDPRAAVGHLSPGRRAGRRDRECLAEWHVQPRTPGSHLLLPGPRLVFNRVNGRRPPATSPSLEGTQETYTLAHEENVRFVSEAWQQVEQQLGSGPTGDSGPRPVQYVEKTPSPRLQNFVPIDLDEWWAQQFLARITNCS